MGDSQVRVTRSGDAAQSEASSPYIWANCRSKGWQVLIPVENLRCTRPEPPECVLRPKRGLQKLQNSDETQTPTHLPLPPPSATSQPIAPSVEIDNTTANTGEVWKTSLNKSPQSQHKVPDRKDFVAANRSNVSPVNRATRVSILEQAAKQLRESEKIGDSLAARLKIIKKQLDTYPKQ